MKTASKKCILCIVDGNSAVWNGLEILSCPNCSLSWRATFDLPLDHYNTVEVDSEDNKKKKRAQNASNQIGMLKKYLPPTDIFDLGAGDGTFLSALRDRGYKNCLGIEPGENGLKISKERGLNVFKGKIADLPKYTADRKVAAISLFHLLEHLDDPKEELAIIRNALTLGGVLIIETPDNEAPIQRLTNHKNHLVYPEHFFYWSAKSVRKLLEQTGFEVLTIKHRSFDWPRTSITNSLFRLGLIKKKAKKAEENSNTSIVDRIDISETGGPEPTGELKKSHIRSVVRTILAYVVHFLKRDDYILVVASKTKGIGGRSRTRG